MRPRGSDEGMESVSLHDSDLENYFIATPLEPNELQITIIPLAGN